MTGSWIELELELPWPGHRNAVPRSKSAGRGRLDPARHEEDRVGAERLRRSNRIFRLREALIDERTIGAVEGRRAADDRVNAHSELLRDGADPLGLRRRDGPRLETFESGSFDLPEVLL